MLHMIHLLGVNNEELQCYLVNHDALRLSYESLYSLASDNIEKAKSGVEAICKFIIQLDKRFTTIDTGVVKHTEEAIKIVHNELDVSAAKTHSILEDFVLEPTKHEEKTHSELLSLASTTQQGDKQRVFALEQQLAQALSHAEELEQRSFQKTLRPTHILEAKVAYIEKELKLEALFRIPSI